MRKHPDPRPWALPKCPGQTSAVPKPERADKRSPDLRRATELQTPHLPKAHARTPEASSPHRCIPNVSKLPAGLGTFGVPRAGELASGVRAWALGRWGVRSSVGPEVCTPNPTALTQVRSPESPVTSGHVHTRAWERRQPPHSRVQTSAQHDQPPHPRAPQTLPEPLPRSGEQIEVGQRPTSIPFRELDRGWSAINLDHFP